MTAGQTAVALSAGFPDGGNTFSIDGRHKVNNAVFLGAGYTLTTLDDSDFGDLDVPSMHTFSVDGGYEVLLSSADTGPQIGLCPNIGFAYSSWEDINFYAIPLGVAFGTVVGLGDRARLAPYASPQLVFNKATAGEIESDWENDFGFSLGANLLVNRYLIGGAFSKVGDSDGAFRIQAGLIF